MFNQDLQQKQKESPEIKNCDLKLWGGKTTRTQHLVCCHVCERGTLKVIVWLPSLHLSFYSLARYLLSVASRLRLSPTICESNVFVNNDKLAWMWLLFAFDHMKPHLRAVNDCLNNVSVLLDCLSHAETLFLISGHSFVLGKWKTYIINIHGSKSMGSIQEHSNVFWDYSYCQ